MRISKRLLQTLLLAAAPLTLGAQDVAIRNATIITITNGDIENGTIVVRNGKIAAVGRDVAIPAGVRVIDGTGKFVMPGIIDAHSHAALENGINEGSESVTPEVQVQLKNASGVDVDASQLPKTLEAMADDPYRSLAWFVRQKGGFCKSAREFAEFAWADWFRSKSPLEIQNLPSDPNDKNATVDEAVEMAHSSEAENLPGYSAVKCQR
jgi:hypothetical protein